MNPLTLLFLATAITFTFADQALHQSLMEVDKDPFGATVLNLISLNLQAQTPIQDLTNLLYDTRDDLSKDLNALETNYQAKKGQLEKALSDAQILFTQYNTTIFNSQQSIISDTNSKQSKQSALTNTQGLLDQEQKRLASIEAAHIAAAANFALDISNLNLAVTNTQNAVDKMGSFSANAVSPYSFLEVSSRAQNAVKKVADNVGKMESTLSKHSNRYQPLIDELMELTSHMEGPRSDAVLKLLGELKTLLQGALQSTKNSQQDEINTYQTDRANSLANSETYNKLIKQYQDEISTLNTRIENSQKDMENARQLKDAVEAKYFADKQALADATALYEDQRPKYEESVKVLDKIIEFFNTNIASVDEYTQNRLNNGF